MAAYKTLQQLFRSKKRWTKGAFARDREHHSVACEDSRAECFCLIGGISVVYPLYLDRIQAECKIHDAAKRLFSRRYVSSFMRFNDHPRTTIEDIRMVFREAGV